MAQFQTLAEVPPEIEWFANLTNANTRRAYEQDINDWKRNKKVAVFVLCSLIRGTMEGAMHHGL